MKLVRRNTADSHPAVFEFEALEAQSAKSWGEPAGLMPQSWTAMTALLLTIVCAAAVFLATASYARKETVRGILRPTARHRTARRARWRLVDSRAGGMSLRAEVTDRPISRRAARASMVRSGKPSAA